MPQSILLFPQLDAAAASMSRSESIAQASDPFPSTEVEREALPKSSGVGEIERYWPAHMRPKLAAAYLGVSKAYLDQARCNGSGPKFVRLSRTMITYRRADLDEFVAARLFSSTAEADAAERSRS